MTGVLMTMENKDISETPVVNLPQIIVTEEFKEALYRIFELRQNILLLGDAGSGKSTFIKILKRNLKGNAVFLAPTGIAAVNIKGQTIHSFFSFPPKPVSIYDLKYSAEKLEIMEHLDRLIIDEISMVRVDVFEGINFALQLAKGNNLPFGGVQIICIGDLAQLPPVLAKGSADADLIGHLFKSAYFFDGPCYTKAEFHKMRFTKVFRQTDLEYIDFLNRVKNGASTFDDIKWFNEKTKGPLFGLNDAINVVTTNAQALDINNSALSAINSPIEVYDAKIEGTFDPRNTNIPERIEIKYGARIMTLVNNPEAGYYNGTCGNFLRKVETDNGPALKIRLDDGKEVFVSRMNFSNVRYEYDSKSSTVGDKVMGTFSQFPLKLSFAVTVHRCQGMTFDKMNLDFGRGTFASGMSYVALSRCRTLDGIRLKRPLSKSDIYFDPRIMMFIKYGE